MNRFLFLTFLVVISLAANNCIAQNVNITDAIKAIDSSNRQSDPAEDLLTVCYDSIFHNEKLYFKILPKVKRLKISSDSVINFIDSTLNIFYTMAGGKNSFETSAIVADLEISKDYFITKGNGEVLRNRLLNYYSGLLIIVPKRKMKKDIKKDISDLKASDAINKYFDSIPIYAGVTILEKVFKGNVRSRELIIVKDFLKKNGAR